MGVTVALERCRGNSRRCFAGVEVSAPVECVWKALTDYDCLADFIPGLVENTCLSRHAQGARLRQVGEQNLLFGAKFRAAVVLDIEEYESGLPEEMFEESDTVDYVRGRFPNPRGAPEAPSRDLTFSLVEGDFQEFEGVWRMQQLVHNNQSESTFLSYALYVKPQIWLPVRLIQGRIQSEISANLQAVQQHSEALWLAGREAPICKGSDSGSDCNSEAGSATDRASCHLATLQV